MNKKIKQKTYETILQDRTHLTDYEKNLLIPELKYRLEALKQDFGKIIQLCDIQKGSRGFTNNLNSIINPQGLSNVQANQPQNLSDKFFDTIKNQAQIENVDEIDKILKKYETIADLKTMGMFLNEVNFLCSSLLAVKNNLFLFKIEGYPFILNKSTGQTVAAQPVQYFITTEPFQIAINQIMSVAAATSKTIHEWHKQAMELKSQFISLYTKNLSMQNSKRILSIQILTILLAVILSAFFLVASDPFNLLKRNQELKREIIKLKKENTLLKSEQAKTGKSQTRQTTRDDSK